jgi:hypothetical protein
MICLDLKWSGWVCLLLFLESKSRVWVWVLKERLVWNIHAVMEKRKGRGHSWKLPFAIYESGALKGMWDDMCLRSVDFDVGWTVISVSAIANAFPKFFYFFYTKRPFILFYEKYFIKKIFLKSFLVCFKNIFICFFLIFSFSLCTTISYQSHKNILCSNKKQF